MKKQSLKIYALILSLLMLLTALVVLPASATDGTTPDVYYFTDSLDSAAVDLVYQECQSYGSLVSLYHEPNPEYFWYDVFNWSITSTTGIVPDPEEISNAHIIFEFTQLYPVDLLQLAMLFEDFKTSSDNKLMFICDIDETRLGDETELGFLTDFVDIHVNTDLRTPFISNVVEEISEPATIIFDRNSWTYDINGNIQMNDPFDFYFFEYWAWTLGDTSYLGALHHILTDPNSNINILCRESETRFIDVKSTLMNQNTFVSASTAEELEYECEEYFLSSNVYVVTTTYLNSSNGLEDLLFAQDLREMLLNNGYDFQIYFYDEYDTPLPAALDLPLATETDTPLPTGEYIKDLGRGLPYFESTLLMIIQNFFIADEQNTSLQQYHNWDGACNISHKATMAPGVNGWIDCLGGFPFWIISNT